VAGKNSSRHRHTAYYKQTNSRVIGNEMAKDDYTINSSDDYTYYGGDYFIGSLDDTRFTIPL
jgi:hypothetical protein